ncbi:MAG: FKBP-type peptidyl-prolyl cis-trans isomerase [Crocinitomicaceae bacterium]|nr:FKBP-type peptidyl-prolyl cis-trans isomerase [Crocinitomicaceae bacterium]
MKKLLFILPLFALVACGEGDSIEEPVVLDTYEHRLSYTLGAMNAKSIVQSNDPNVNKYDKEQMAEGFEDGLTTEQSQDCMETLRKLFGANGQDFDTTYLEEGSRCIGRITATSFYTELTNTGEIGKIDNEKLIIGFKHGLYGNDTVITQADQMKLVDEFIKNVTAKKEKETEATWGENKTIGEAFLAENSKKKGIVVTASGLQYEVIKPGSGLDKPVPSSQVTVHYHGTLIDGTVFDSSVDRGQPYSTGVTQVIAGWTEVLQLMPKGAKYRVYVPQELAYGAYPQPGGAIKPYSALIFDVELLDF